METAKRRLGGTSAGPRISAEGRGALNRVPSNRQTVRVAPGPSRAGLWAVGRGRRPRGFCVLTPSPPLPFSH